MTTPLEKIAEEKNGNYQSSLKGGGKRPIYFRFFLLKASLSNNGDIKFVWWWWVGGYKRSLVQKNFGFEKMFGSNNFRSKENLSLKKFGPRTAQPKKNYDSQKIGSQKFGQNQTSNSCDIADMDKYHQLPSIKHGLKILPLKWGQNLVSNCLDIPDMDKCCQDI